MNIIALSIKRPSLVIVIFTIITLTGLIGSSFLGYELVPSFSPPYITVLGIYPGATPIEVENSVVKPMENLVSELENIKRVYSSSFENYCFIRVECKDGADVDMISNELQKKFTQNRARFPDEMEPPNIGKFNLEDLPIMKIALNADLNETELYELVENEVKPSLTRLEGVADVSILGGQPREIQVNLFRNKLEAFNVSIGMVLEAIARANVELPAGQIKNSERQILVRFAGKFEDLESLKKLVVFTMPDGTNILLGEIAEIIDTKKAPDILVRNNGNEAIGINIQKQSDANAVQVSALVREQLAELTQTYAPQNLKTTILQDSSVFTLEAAQGVFQDLLLAIILVGMIMFIFLKSLRNSLIIMLVVPISLVATLGVMYFLGYTFNLLSLLGLTLAVGTLVDDAIVVIENIYRHIEMGKHRLQAAYDATRELGLTLVATTLTLVVVFVPITLVGGLVTSLLTQFAITIAVAVLFSTFVAFTIVPLLASRMAKIENFDSNPVLKYLIIYFDKGVDVLGDSISRMLKWALRHKTATLLLTGGLFVGSISMVTEGYIGVDFLAAGDRGEFLIQLELPKDATLEQTNQIALEAELLIKERPEVLSIFSTIGISGAKRLAQGTPFLAELSIALIDKNLRELPTEIIARQVKLELERKIVGAKIQPVSINILGFADRAPVDILILHPNMDTLESVSQQIKNLILPITGIVELETSLEDGTPELVIQINRAKLSSLGLTAGQVALILRTALTGNTDNKFRNNQSDYDINVRLDSYDRQSLEDLLQLSFMTQKGQRIYMYEFAEIKESEGPAMLQRANRSPMASVRAQIAGRAVGDVNFDVTSAVSSLKLPSGTQIIYDGAQEQQAIGFEKMTFAGIASILLLYLIMVALYDSFVYPFVVLFTIPLAVIGAFLALGISNSLISLFSLTGLMMLVGLVAKNAILVVDFTVELRKKGVELREALIEATRLRLRPVLMTNISMIIGLIPIGLATGAGAEWKNGLGWALVGGLTSSMFLSLIVVPVIYFVMERMMAFFGMDKREKIELEE